MKPDPSYEEKYFERAYWGGYSKIGGMIKKEYRKRLELLPDGFKTSIFEAGNNALDIGCAYGYVMEMMSEIGYEAYGIDISRFALKKLRERGLGNIALCDAQHPLPFGVKFRLITCFEVLEHLRNVRIALKNLYDSLDEKGMLIISTPNPWSLHGILSERESTHINVKSPVEWRRLLYEFPWKDLVFAYRDYLPGMWKITNKFNWFTFPILGLNLIIACKR